MLAYQKREEAIKAGGKGHDVMLPVSASSAADKAFISLLHAESRQKQLLHVTLVSITIATDKSASLKWILINKFILEKENKFHPSLKTTMQCHDIL